MTRHAHMLLAVVAALATVAFATVSGAEVITRTGDWDVATNFTNGNNDHGGVGNTSGTVWTYHHQSGNGQSTLDPSLTWNNVWWYATNSRFHKPDANGWNAGFVKGFRGSVQAYWNHAPTPTNDFKPPWAIVMYNETDAAGRIYDIGGKLKWKVLGAPSQAINIEIAKISGTTATTLFSASVANGSNGTYEVSGFDVSTLKNVHLAQGEGIAFGIRGSTSQFRYIDLLDDEVTLTVVPEPTVTALLLAGGGVLMLRRRCRKAERISRP